MSTFSKRAAEADALIERRGDGACQEVVDRMQAALRAGDEIDAERWQQILRIVERKLLTASE